MDPFKTLILGTPPSRTYTGSAVGLLTAANNLSDVADVATAKVNLGVLTGTTTNDNAATGNIGEYLSSTAVLVSLTTDVDTNITSVSLTAGDWDVEGTVVFTPTNSPSLVLAGVSSTSGTAPTGTDGLVYIQTSAFPSGSTQQISSGTRRFSLSATTTVYLVAKAVFASGTCTANGTIRARRTR